MKLLTVILSCSQATKITDSSIRLHREKRFVLFFCMYIMCFLCMCVSMHTCMHVSICVCLYVYACCMFVFVHVCVCAFVFVCVTKNLSVMHFD